MNAQYLSEKILEKKMTLLNLSIEHWLNYELYTWQWWIKFVYLAIPIIIWYKLADRKRILEIVSYGLLVSLISTVLDSIGVTFVLWNYPIRLLPIGLSAVHDLVIIPITYMLIFQYYSKWKSFIIASILLAAVASYIIEPLYTLIGIYQAITWKHIYSFFIYIILAFFCKSIIDKLTKFGEKS